MIAAPPDRATAGETVADEFDRLVRDWTPYAEAWVRRQEWYYPGEDWWPAAGDGLWKAAARWEPRRGGFRTWLCANLWTERVYILKRWRRRRRLRDDLLAALTEDPADSDPGVDMGVLPEVLEEIDALPPRQAEAIRRYYLGGESYAEIARHWGTRPESPRFLARRGVARLREILTTNRSPAP